MSSLCLSFHEQKEDNKKLHLVKMVFRRAHQVSSKRSSVETIVMGPTRAGDANPLNGRKSINIRQVDNPALRNNLHKKH